MSTLERPVDRGAATGARLVAKIGGEIRLARRNLGLSLATVADAGGISISELARIERARAPWVSVVTLARICAVVGLDLSAKTYPGGRPVRDVRQARLLAKFRRLLHPSLGWGTEVPLPSPGDLRAWDGFVRGSGWRYGVEAELNPLDGQALLRRLRLKERDGLVDGVILLVPDTRQARRFRREYAELLAAGFPVGSRQALGRLAEGRDPGGSAVIVLP